MRSAVAALVALAMLAVGAAVVAWQQRDDAVFAQVLAEADRVEDTDPSLSAQLDLVAHRLREDDEGANNRLISIVNAPLATPLRGHTGAVYLTTFSPNGRLLATASYDRTVRLWDVSDRTRPEPLGPPPHRPQQLGEQRASSAPTAAPWPAPATTARSGCGTYGTPRVRRSSGRR